MGRAFNRLALANYAMGSQFFCRAPWLVGRGIFGLEACFVCILHNIVKSFVDLAHDMMCLSL